MLNKTAFANALAVLTAIFYFVFYLLNLVSRPAFEFLFNAQFLGANVSPPRISPGTFVGTLIALVVSGWVFGYLLAWLYNKFNR
jgi:hypothetical protein